ncbi:MAG TPA: hypothetical protein VK165_20195 [Azonexus sp.]|nr:hypothetical protein [Azonexus sp.]
MSEKAISIVEAEWEALDGLPYLQVRLYMVLRWYMDVATGRVGDVRGISLQSLAEELYVEPAPGRSESGSPTKKAVRSALQQLEKHGLISPCGNGEVLVFFLPKAGSVPARQKAKGHKRGTVSGHAMGHGETPAPQGFSDVMGHAMGHTQNGLKGHTSEVRVNPLSVETSAATLRAVDNFADPAAVLLDAAQIAEWIRLHERKRGCLAQVTRSDVENTDWIARGVTVADLHEAYALAVNSRVMTQNAAPVNVGFISVFMRDVLGAGKAVCRKANGRNHRWHDTQAGIEAMAARVGIARREGEEMHELRMRVNAELLQREAVERQLKKAARQRKENGDGRG